MARDAVLPLAWLALLAALPGQQAAAPPDPRALALAWREQAQVPGLLLAWDGPGEQRGAVAVGHADPERRIPLTVAHRFPFGSVGKTFVAAVALQLVAERKLSLDARLAEQLGAPAWLSALPNGNAVTLRMLLRHQSGIPDHVDTDAFWTAALADPDKSWRGDELAAFVAGRSPLFAPGDGWAYADTNYVLVGLAIERASGCAWHAEVVTRLLAPHALTGIEPSLGRELAQLSNGVSALAGDRLRGAMLRDGVARVNFQLEHCGGGLHGTPADLARFFRLLGEGRLLAPDSFAAMCETVEAPRVGGRYGLGIIERNGTAGRSLGHSGWFPGWRTEAAWFETPKLAVVVVTNGDDLRGLRRAPHLLLAEAAAALR